MHDGTKKFKMQFYYSISILYLFFSAPLYFIQMMPRIRSNFGRRTRRTEARRRVIANQNEEQRGSANDRYRQIMAQIRSEEAA